MKDLNEARQQGRRDVLNKVKIIGGGFRISVGNAYDPDWVYEKTKDDLIEGVLLEARKFIKVTEHTNNDGSVNIELQLKILED